MTVLWDGPAPQPIQKWVVSRRFDRIAIEFPVTVQAGGKTHRGRSLNLSEGGIAIVSPVPLNRSQEVTITFSLPDQPQPITTTAAVRHASGFQHGCEFWGISPEERQMIATFVQSRTEPKR